MPPVEFEPTTSTGQRPLTHAFDRAATGTGLHFLILIYKNNIIIIVIVVSERCFIDIWPGKVCVFLVKYQEASTLQATKDM